MDPHLTGNKEITSDAWAIRRVLNRHVRALLGMTLGGALLGLLAGFVLPAQYTATMTLLPELQPGQAVNLQPFRELAELMGHDFDARRQVEAIRPDLYPAILKSVPFALTVLHEPVITASGQKESLYGLLSRPSPFFSTDSLPTLPQPALRPIRLTTRQQELVDELQTLIRASLDAKTGIMTISAEMPDPEVAAQVAQFAANYLQTFVRAYRTEKARADEQFAYAQMREARQAAYSLERTLLSNQDQTRFLSLPSASLTSRRLLSQYESANGLYQELKREHAKAKIQVQAVTPVFKVLEPVRVPDRRSSPRRFWLVLAGSVSALLLGILCYLIRDANSLPA